jgi:hypothetical protein
VQDGGGRAEQLVLLSVLSSRDTRVQTARYGSSRHLCSFLAAAAPARSQNGQIRRSSGVKKNGLYGRPPICSTYQNTGVAA